MLIYPGFSLFLKKVLARNSRCANVTAFWGEQQAIAAIVAVACIFSGVFFKSPDGV
jgi:hypothetical protein